MSSLFIFGVLLVNAANLAAAAPVLARNHPLLNSPLFNTPLPPPPSALGSLFPVFFRSRQDPKPDAADLDTRSHHGKDMSNPKPHLLSAITVTVTATVEPQPQQSIPPPPPPRLLNSLHHNPNPRLNPQPQTTSTTVQSLLTFPETVAFTTTALPAVTVTGAADAHERGGH
ncbi:uncharacterized protein B0H64DRAFT_8327 [Chaetomium fimeti]|uniref:Uncharacterized protein n=1 Tax=Chaetomium fimeti TaxID=1854472 RepID=A0AAE0HP43_9PEZI|nr:hypothetical protein B0H64DRAFT_8327 [Chaetomium fimeti]